MLRVVLEGKKNNEPQRVLCLGAHCDDIEIGCGGTILRLLEAQKDFEFCWVVFSSTPNRALEASKSAELFLSESAKKEIIIKDFRDGFFPYIGGQIKEYFEDVKTHFSPDLVFTHYRNDLHQDHRLISELTWNTFRDQLILEYEIPKVDGDLGNPNFFVHLKDALCRKKVQYLLDCFVTQKEKPWFNRDTFFSMLNFRGIESRAPEGYSEAYYARKMVF
jgi:LmbE family N-acetylglucosaminyl deacetylase